MDFFRGPLHPRQILFPFNTNTGHRMVRILLQRPHHLPTPHHLQRCQHPSRLSRHHHQPIQQHPAFPYVHCTPPRHLVCLAQAPRYGLARHGLLVQSRCQDRVLGVNGDTRDVDMDTRPGGFHG